MSFLALIVLSSCAFAALALGMERHWHQVSKRALPPSRRNLLRFVGWVLLAAALSVSVVGWGASIGVVAWFGVSTVVGLALAFALPKFSHQLTRRFQAATQSTPTSFAASTGRMRFGQWLAAVALVVTPVAFAWQLHREETRPLLSADALRGEIGPWSFVFAEADRNPPEFVTPGVPMKHYQIRFCAACDRHIRAAYLKVDRPRSPRALGMRFEGEHRERYTAIQLPPHLSGDKELWLTVEGKDGSVHQTSLRMDVVSPATVLWFERKRNP